MGELDIGLAMVTARIATSEMEREREQEVRKNRENRMTGIRPEKRAGRRNPFLPGAKLEVVKGELVLVPSAEAEGNIRTRGWTLTREDGNVLRIEAGEVVGPQGER